MQTLTFHKWMLKLKKGIKEAYMVAFDFDRAKAIEAILYLANRISDSDRYSICKLLYYTDKTCLEKYGRFIFGESYTAMKEGSTPSNAYDLLKEIARKPIAQLEVEGNNVIPLRDANLDYFSESDIECLGQIISVYGKMPSWKRGEDAHDVAWRKAWRGRGTKRSAGMSIKSIAESLNDSKDLIDYLANRGAD